MATSQLETEIGFVTVQLSGGIIRFSCRNCDFDESSINPNLRRTIQQPDVAVTVEQETTATNARDLKVGGNVGASETGILAEASFGLSKRSAVTEQRRVAEEYSIPHQNAYAQIRRDGQSMTIEFGTNPKLREPVRANILRDERVCTVEIRDTTESSIIDARFTVAPYQIQLQSGTGYFEKHDPNTNVIVKRLTQKLVEERWPIQAIISSPSSENQNP